MNNHSSNIAVKAKNQAFSGTVSTEFFSGLPAPPRNDKSTPAHP
jgi:hypothetical protein